MKLTTAKDLHSLLGAAIKEAEMQSNSEVELIGHAKTMAKDSLKELDSAIADADSKTE